jgi:CubicO group peptidase (beta-lactamase class C family)
MSTSLKSNRCAAFCAKFNKKRLITIALFFLVVSDNVHAQTTALQHSKPEAEGVSAAGIDSFLTAVSHSKNEFHSFVFLRHGKVVAEGWWNPYRPDLKHTLYSVSKSFTSTAVGFAVSEGRLKVTDKVVSFFPNSLPDTISPYLAQLTVKNLLTMSVGMEPDPTGDIAFKTTDWVKAFLATPIKHQPGSVFLYNTMASFMLSAIVKKVTGQSELEYLKPRLFNPLGITGEDWEANPQGINTGGWGLRLKTEDMAKLGQLYLQKGMWKGKQLLPTEWVNEATTFKIDQAPNAPQSKKDSSDWMQGYCYQFWRCRHNAFRGDGAMGQYIIVMPDEDAVVAITSETADMQDEINLVWKYLLPAMHPQPRPANSHADLNLTEHISKLSLAPLLRTAGSATFIDGKTFALKPNDLHIKSISFHYSNAGIRVSLKKDSAAYDLNFQTGKWQPGETNMPAPNLLLGANEDVSYMLPYKIAGSYTLLDDHTVQFKLRYIESLHSETITCHFDKDGISMNATVVPSVIYRNNKKVELQSE